VSSAIHFSQLRHYQPMSTFPRDQLIELARAGRVAEPRDRGLVFDPASEPSNESLYLLAGAVSAVTTNGVAEIVESGTPAAVYPLNDGRFQSIIAFSDTVILYLPFDLIDLLSTWDQLSVVERRGGDRETGYYGRGIPRRWRHSFFAAVRGTPSACIEELMQSFEPLAVQERQVIAYQGEAVDHFFVVDSGTALATRESPADEGESIELAELNEGECFCAEALTALPQSTTTVTMITDGVLLRLHHRDFARLQGSPQQPVLSRSAAIETISTGAHWLDVRQRDEWQHAHLPGAHNLPLQEIRLRASSLDQAVHYVCYCNSGRRAAAAAQLLKQLGIDASIFNGPFRKIGLL
jgi:rhodanese-related sulfurtransferase